jgi:hypothetical protein
MSMPNVSVNMRCKKCGYDLRGQKTQRCPECGDAFDPRIVSTYLTKPVSGTRYVILALISAFLVATSWFTTTVFEIFSIKLPPVDSPLGILMMISILGGLLTGVAISWHVVQQGFKALKGKLPWIENRGGFTLSLFICGVIYFGFLGLTLYQLLSR